MSMQDEPGGGLSSEEEAELRAFRRIASALERGDVEELAAALSQDPDAAWPGPGSHERPKEN
jgi:hypothetical protein